MIDNGIGTGRIDQPMTCCGCEVRHNGICSALNAAELAELSKQSRRSCHHAGDKLIGESTEIVSYANVIRGVVKLSKVLEDGRQQLVGLQFAPDLIGRIYGTESQNTIEAASVVELCRVPRSSLETLVADNPRLQARILKQTLKDLDEARDWMVTLGRKTASEKISCFLYLIASHVDPDLRRDPSRPVRFELPLSRADIGDFLGLTIETVSRQLTKLRLEGVIRIVNHRHVEVTELRRLLARCG